ncbi:hypothetical protein BpHYR1_020985 [Brachionus plicatilis]|uniref:Uncharacterized protein n=1 Tax=Brachionus plicatilis TaxID=10195 RepID=A0A3M7T1G3_BRAPC|nr:hypothetical protein BpHYR1_020985 [Brachionus plicatilis]
MMGKNPLSKLFLYWESSKIISYLFLCFESGVLNKNKNYSNKALKSRRCHHEKKASVSKVTNN